jgi:two-component system sensor histidine kinase YesM
MLIVVAVAVFSFNLFTEKEIELYSNKSVLTIGNTFNTMTDECLIQMNYMLSDVDIYLFMITDGTGYTFYHDDVIYKQIQVQMIIKDYLESIYIYSDARDKIVSNFGEIESARFFDTGWMEEYRALDKSVTFHSSFRDSYNSYMQPVRILSFYKPLFHGEVRKGVVVYNINFDKFQYKLSDLRSEFDSGLCITDGANNVLQEVWGMSENYLQEYDANYDFRNRIGSYIVYKTPIKNTDMMFVSALQPEVSKAKLNPILNTMLLVILLGFLFVILITVLVSFRLYNPFKKIINALNSPTLLMEGKIVVNSAEESLILQSIRKNVQENEEIYRQLRERVALLKRAQSIALQSQINPHFLHNTLDAINWAAMRLTGGKNNASTMITKLAGMMRYSLGNIDNMVTLNDELENVRTYLDLQSIRYKDKFLVEWDIAKETTNCRVIKIMLQPIIENAIYHGIKPLEGSGKISISTSIQQESDTSILMIQIADSGIGIPHKQLISLNGSMRSEIIREEDAIGISNVNQRIKIIFGSEYGITFSYCTDSGTVVSIALPISYSGGN